MFIESIFNSRNVTFCIKTFSKNFTFQQYNNHCCNFIHFRFLSSVTPTNLENETLKNDNLNSNIKLNDRKILSSSLTLMKYDKTRKYDCKPKIAVLFGWMLSKDRNLEKYAKIYARYNFDILLVKTSPKQLIFPKNGSIKNAQNILEFIKNNNQYSQVIFHGFSVGGYQFGEILVKLSQNPHFAKQLIPLVKACIFDSVADLNNLPRGFSYALTNNYLLQQLFYFFMITYLKLFYFVATRYYRESENQFYSMQHLKVPILIIVSEIDKVGSIESNKKVADYWTKHGVPVKMKIFKDSKHVCHYHKYPKEYEQEIHEILKRTKLI